MKEVMMDSVPCPLQVMESSDEGLYLLNVEGWRGIMWAAPSTKYLYQEVQYEIWLIVYIW